VSRAVVLASGGFSRSSKLLQAYAPELVDAVKHGGIANTGDGLIMATALGAGHADLGYVSGSFGGAIRNYPNVVRNDDEIPPLLFAFNSGAIIVNKNGVRFANEAQSYKVLSGICMTQPDGLGFQIFDEKVMSGSLAGTSVNNFKEALADGYIQTAGSIGELAKLMGIDPTALEVTIARYNKDAVSGLDSQFGRKAASGALMRIDTPPYYRGAGTPDDGQRQDLSEPLRHAFRRRRRQDQTLQGILQSDSVRLRVRPEGGGPVHDRNALNIVSR
jgi:fumarate reductase flavoprotein subunit